MLGKENIEMSTVQEIEKALSNLKPQEMAAFRVWFDEFDAAMWDTQFEEDAKSGKLDIVADSAIADYKKGKFKQL